MPIFGRKRDDSLHRLPELFRNPKRYRLIKELGEGGLARVSSCYDAYLGRIVALKELKTPLQHPFLLQSFVNEARLVAYLDHPGVVSVFDMFVLDERRVCLTMTLVEGRSLGAMLETDNVFREGPRLGLTTVVEIFTKIAETMAYVHDRGVIHLDLKPDNVMVGQYGQVMVMDWGSARLYNPEPYREYLRKWTGEDTGAIGDFERRNVVLGTPLYMSPEQTNAPRDLLTPASDVFSAGSVLYEMLTGRRPFEADTNEEAMRKVRTVEPPPPREVNPDVPVRLSQICTKMLAKQPVERYGSFRQVLAELKEFHDSGQAFSTRTYGAGDVIFYEGDTGEYAFTILSGRVEIAKGPAGARTVLATLGPGEIVGELSIFTGQPRTATATALEPTVIRVMNAASVKAELEKLRPWVGAMVRRLSERFIGLNEKLVALGHGE